MTSPIDKPTIAWPATALELKEYLATRNEPTEREKNNAKTERLPMTSPIDKLIAMAEEHDQKATKGPVLIERKDHDSGYFTFAGYAAEDVFLCCEITNQNARNNANFYAASRTAWPATARALKVAIEALRDSIDTIHGEFCGGDSCHPLCHIKALAEIDRIAKEGLDE